MASSASKVPSKTTSTTTAARKSPVRPQTAQPSSSFPIYPLYPSQNIPIKTPNISNSNPSSSQSQPLPLIYPVASSGRGFIARPVRPPDQTTVTLANNPTNFNMGTTHPRGVGVNYKPIIAAPSGLTHHHHHATYHHLMRQHPTYQLQQQQQHFTTAAAASLPPIQGLPVTAPLKAASSPLPVSDSNGYKNSRDRSRDDNLVTVRDRKVKISDGASLYALCRSWLRNGFAEENQPHYGDFVKVLPRPLPDFDVDTHSPKKEGEKEVEEEEEDEESVDNLSAEDLLSRHIKRAKKVRARLRERRLKRIARYKTRLAMLLPPQVEQFRNDAAAGN